MSRQYGWLVAGGNDDSNNGLIPVLRTEPVESPRTGQVITGPVFVGTGPHRQQIFVSDETRQQARRQNDRRGRTGLRGPGTL